jgi:RNA polymerase sigma-70 factor (ECF subfamily)
VDHDTALVVRDALAKLPMEQRAALVLVDLQGYPVAEVAAILGVAEGTVKSRCARGRAKLAGMLGHLRPAAGGGPAEPNSAAAESALVGNPVKSLDVPSAMALDGTADRTAVDGTVPNGAMAADGTAGPLEMGGSPARTNAEEQ